MKSPYYVSRRTSSAEQSPAEQQAQGWHDATHQLGAKTCWCCCQTCKVSNPYLRAAQRAALDDIAARLADSMAPIRVNSRSGYDDEDEDEDD